MTWLLALLALSLVVFGGGMFCGFLLFRRPPSISVVLPNTSLTEPIESLQQTIYRFDRQLTHHVERLTHDTDELRSASTTSSQVGKLILANENFEKQLAGFSADVRQARCDLGALVPNGQPAEEPARRGTPALKTQNSSEPEPNACRTEQRHPFLCRQWIARYSGVRAPDAEEFFTVQCRDISSGGVSFFLDRMPLFQMVVIRLNALDEPKYLTARIQRTEPSTNLEHGRYIVGCQLLGALHPSALPAGLEASIQRREARRQGSEVAIAGPPRR